MWICYSDSPADFTSWISFNPIIVNVTKRPPLIPHTQEVAF